MKHDASEVPSRRAAVIEKSFMMFGGRWKRFKAGGVVMVNGWRGRYNPRSGDNGM